MCVEKEFFIFNLKGLIVPYFLYMSLFSKIIFLDVLGALAKVGSGPL